MSFLVLGMGRTGCAVSRYLLRCGEKVVAVDDHASWESIPEEFSRHPFFHFLPSAEISKCDFSSIEECIASPGFPPQHPLFTFLEQKDVRVISEIEFAGRLIHFPLVGVTGSCGKSTTVALVGHVLRRAGLSVFVGGNFGVALIESLERRSHWDWGVVEVSSFQLERTYTVRFSVASLLNVFPNHLDYHQTMENYFRAKSRIFAHQQKEDVSVLNFTHPEWQSRVVRCTQAKMVPVAVSKRLYEGFFIENETVWKADFPRREILSISQCPLLGKHNWENALVAIAVVSAVGVNLDFLPEFLSDFQSLPHRLEQVGCVNGVWYVNDSKATTPAAAKVAIEAVEGPLILILGGKAKIADFSELGEVFSSGKIREVIVYGISRLVVARFIPPEIPRHLVSSLSEAVAVAKNIARKGDTVLFSPACTSWDQYRSFEERGDHFRQLVRQVDP